MNQQDAQIPANNLFYYFILLFFTCSTCFGRITLPSSGALSSKLYHAVGTFVRASPVATWLYNHVATGLVHLVGSSTQGAYFARH